MGIATCFGVTSLALVRGTNLTEGGRFELPRAFDPGGFQDRCLQPGSATPPDGASPLTRDGARAKGRMRARTAPAAAGAGLSHTRRPPTMRRCGRWRRSE